METRQLIICRGIQGSGKPTWAKQWCHEDPEHRIRFNNDDIRNMLGDYWVPNREKESLITPENGFRLIETLEAGMSPLSVVYQRDLEYEKLMNKSNEIQG